MKIIFVCTGNTCRSPMAEGFFNMLCAKGDKISAISRGTFAENGAPASRFSVISAAELGADISDHQASQLTQSDVSCADYIFTMTKAHKDLIVSAFPDFSNKVFSISEFASCPDISDPYGGDLSVYRECAAEIFDATEKIYKILSVNNNEHSL